MLPEIGHFTIILALCFALLQATMPLIKSAKNSSDLLYDHLTLTAAIGQLIFLGLALLALILCFLVNDMSVRYVQEHSHTLLPFIYKVGAAWGGHEGSLLLWCLILSGWTCAFIVFSKKQLPVKLFTRILMVLGWLSSGFILFLFFTSNPFQRIFPTEPILGDDLTPILQDPGLIFHPPMLYLGYVGFGIGFAFAICALLEKKFDSTWAKACRPWIILPWSFLGIGIVLGSWWAYRELGWGGWWFWDPVENASLLPWLSATALLHSLIVSEKRDVFKGWTILLALITFTLCLIGTFLVRSGVLVSVHAFANDPTRGIFLLAYLAFIVGSALSLYAARISYFFQQPRFALFSRETFLLINTVILLSATATILLGTLYPILLDALNLEKISIGEPYFNLVFVPIMLPSLLLMGVAPHVHWQKHSFYILWKKLRLNFILTLGIAFLLPPVCGFPFHWLTGIGLFLGLWIITGTLQFLYQYKNTLGLQHGSMVVAHLGIAILALGIVMNKSYSEERQVKMSRGETVTLATYHIKLYSVQDMQGPNYQSIIATFKVNKNSGLENQVIAEQRIYTSHEQMLSKAGILFNLWRDIYIALGSPLPDGSWAVRIYYKPFVRWIWAGGFLLLLGGVLSLVRKTTTV